MSTLVPRERIEQTIRIFRGHRVMLDTDLAELYGVTVGRLKEAVKRNADRFPSDFMFQLTKPEFENLKSQIAISSSEWGGRRPKQGWPRNLSPYLLHLSHSCRLCGG